MTTSGVTWPTKTLAELGGKVTSGSRGWAAHYSEHGSLFVRITNLTRDRIRLDLTNPRFVEVDQRDAEAIRTRLAPGDLLVSITADVGIIGYVDEDVPSPAYINQHIARVRLDSHLADSRFVAYYLSSWGPQRAFVGSTDTGAKAGMNLATVARLETAVPPLGEQTKIAEALVDVDDLIATLERLIAKKQAIKQGMLQQLLTGRTRLPGFGGRWVDATIGELAKLRTGSPKKQSPSGRYWIVDMGSVTREGEFIVSKKTSLADDFLKPGELVMPKDDIGGGLIIGRTGLISEPNTYVLADHVYALTPVGIDPAFLNYSINSYEVNTSLRSKATGSAQLGLSSKSVTEQLIHHPPTLEEQRSIAGVISDSEAEVRALRQRLAKARAIKTGMMQQLLTGRTRLPLESTS